MKIIERKGSLFNAPNDLKTDALNLIFVQCISADFALGAGIAKIFADKHNVRNVLNSKYYRDVWYSRGYALFTHTDIIVMNLVTKEKYYNKPTYETLKESLENLKNQLLDSPMLLEKILVMPKIGCGLDGLEWSKVKNIIEEIFKDIDVRIYFYSLYSIRYCG